MSVESLLREEIQSELGELRKMEVGSEDYKAAVDGLAKLMDRSIELEKLEMERVDKKVTREIDADLRTQSMESENKDRLIRNCIAVAGIVIPSAITIWGTIKSIEFEKEGTITTIMGRGFIQKLLPKK